VNGSHYEDRQKKKKRKALKMAKRKVWVVHFINPAWSFLLLCGRKRYPTGDNPKLISIPIIRELNPRSRSLRMCQCCMQRKWKIDDERKALKNDQV